MKKMKLLLPALAVFSIALSACGNGGDAPIPTFPQTIETDYHEVGMFVEEEFKLTALATFKSPVDNLKYYSLDESIAKVDENGIITGVSQGETHIVIVDENNALRGTAVPVKVCTPLKTRKGSKLLNSFIEKDVNITSISDHELYQKTIKVNGVQKSHDRFDQLLVASLDDAYFRITETDATIRVGDKNLDYSDYEWVFLVDEYYDSYVYHTSGLAKNYFRVPTASYVGQDRYVPLCEILDNLFRDGRDVYTGVFDNAMFSGAFKNISSAGEDREVGSLGDGRAVFTATASFPDTADQDMETDYGIPYGTEIDETQSFRFIVENNRIVNYCITAVDTYTIGDDEYEVTYQIEHRYSDISEDKKELSVPDKKEYNLVDNLFSI